MTRVAAIDCGTNSLRLLVADVPAQGAHTDLLRRMEIVRLGQGVDATGRLAPEALERTRAALADYTVAQLADVGNEEFLNWMVALGAAGDATATVYYEPDNVATGIGFAIWHVGAGRMVADRPSNLHGLVPA